MILAESLPKWKIRQNLQPNSFLFNFPCILLRFDGQKHNFRYFFSLVVAHVSTGMTIRYAFWKKKHLIFTANCMVYFTPMEAKYTPLDNSVPVWQQL